MIARMLTKVAGAIAGGSGVALASAGVALRRELAQQLALARRREVGSAEHERASSSLPFLLPPRPAEEAVRARDVAHTRRMCRVVERKGERSGHQRARSSESVRPTVRTLGGAGALHVAEEEEVKVAGETGRSPNRQPKPSVGAVRAGESDGGACREAGNGGTAALMVGGVAAS